MMLSFVQDKPPRVSSNPTPPPPRTAPAPTVHQPVSPPTPAPTQVYVTPPQVRYYPYYGYPQSYDVYRVCAPERTSGIVEIKTSINNFPYTITFAS